MTEISLNQSSNYFLAKEENQLDWNKVVERLKKTFGNDIYESWIQNVKLKKEFSIDVTWPFFKERDLSDFS